MQFLSACGLIPCPIEVAFITVLTDRKCIADVYKKSTVQLSSVGLTLACPNEAYKLAHSLHYLLMLYIIIINHFGELPQQCHTFKYVLLVPPRFMSKMAALISQSYLSKQ